MFLGHCTTHITIKLKINMISHSLGNLKKILMANCCGIRENKHFGVYCYISYILITHYFSLHFVHVHWAPIYLRLLVVELVVCAI